MIVRRSITSASIPSAASASAASSARGTICPAATSVIASPCARDPRHAEGHEVLAHRHLALGGEERLRLQHDDRVAGAQRRLHQPLGVRRRRGHADDEPRHMREDRMIDAAVVRPRAAQRPGAHPHHHRRRHLAVAHVAQLRRLQEDLPRRLEGEVGEHQIRHRPRPGRRGPHRRGGEPLLRDRRVDHPLGAELLPEPLGMGEAAAALAGPLAEVHDRRVRPHLLGEPVAHRVEPAHLLGRARPPPASAPPAG